MPIACPACRWGSRLRATGDNGLSAGPRCAGRHRSFTERPEVAAGRRGEQNTRRWVGKHLSTNFGAVFGGKRVPRDMKAASMGRYEIDLVVVTPRRVVA